jgi:hypothetical protein
VDEEEEEEEAEEEEEEEDNEDDTVANWLRRFGNSDETAADNIVARMLSVFRVALACSARATSKALCSSLSLRLSAGSALRGRLAFGTQSRSISDSSSSSSSSSSVDQRLPEVPSSCVRHAERETVAPVTALRDVSLSRV